MREINLGKLERIHDLRGVWNNEPRMFTPWLVEHIDMLNDALGMSLSVIESESSVGKYFSDIFAEDSYLNEKVIIENQLEKTDHDHLGKIITYAAGKQAKTLIWVMKTANDEHRLAIQWLNEHTTEDIKFFLVEIQLWRINDSLPALKFEVIESPNNWLKTINKIQSNSSDSEQLK